MPGFSGTSVLHKEKAGLYGKERLFEKEEPLFLT